MAIGQRLAFRMVEAQDKIPIIPCRLKITQWRARAQKKIAGDGSDGKILAAMRASLLKLAVALADVDDADELEVRSYCMK